jgi:hypothetical protein
MPSPLSDADLARYDVDGFVLLRGFFGESDLAGWRARFAAITDGAVTPAPDMR